MRARLVAVTDDARQALGTVEAELTHFPFRVGRESRSALTRIAMSIERRLGSTPQINDLYLVEPHTRQYLYVSREHFLIEAEGDRFFLTDRGSVGGTIVNETKIGGNRTGARLELHDEDTIIVGSKSSPFVFRFLTG